MGKPGFWWGSNKNSKLGSTSTVWDLCLTSVSRSQILTHRVNTQCLYQHTPQVQTKVTDEFGPLRLAAWSFVNIIFNHQYHCLLWGFQSGRFQLQTLQGVQTFAGKIILFWHSQSDELFFQIWNECLICSLMSFGPFLDFFMRIHSYTLSPGVPKLWISTADEEHALKNYKSQKAMMVFWRHQSQRDVS